MFVTIISYLFVSHGYAGISAFGMFIVRFDILYVICAGVALFVHKPHTIPPSVCVVTFALFV